MAERKIKYVDLTEEMDEALLSGDVAKFNALIKKARSKSKNGRSPRFDLSNYGLGGQYIEGVDLSYCNLSSIHLNPTDMPGANLEGSEISNLLAYNCNLSNANLKNVTMKHGTARFEKCDMSGVDMTGAELGFSSFCHLSNNSNDATLIGAKLPVKGLKNVRMTLRQMTMVANIWELKELPKNISKEAIIEEMAFLAMQSPSGMETRKPLTEEIVAAKKNLIFGMTIIGTEKAQNKVKKILTKTIENLIEQASPEEEKLTTKGRVAAGKIVRSMAIKIRDKNFSPFIVEEILKYKNGTSLWQRLEEAGISYKEVEKLGNRQEKTKAANSDKKKFRQPSPLYTDKIKPDVGGGSRVGQRAH